MDTSSAKTKMQKLEQVARLYYEENKKQDEIASIMGVSRPFISRMLQEAHKVGIVEINIRKLDHDDSLTLEQAKTTFGLKGGALVSEATENNTLNHLLAKEVLGYVNKLGGGRLGIGWGTLIGTIVEMLEQRVPAKDVITDICPLVGNSGIPIRNYHSSENVRIIAHHTKADAKYLHIPAFAETLMDMELIQHTEHYKTVLREWEHLDIALVNIGNYPSTPDFASIARYGSLLSTRRAVGRMVAYFFDEYGDIIRSDSDFAIQIPIHLLRRCPNVVGICSANVGAKALAGALRTGLISHVVSSEFLLKEAILSVPTA